MNQNSFMKPVRLLILLFSVLVISCQDSIDTNDITVIEGIHLNTTSKGLKNQYDSLDLSKRNFYTKTLLGELDELQNDKIDEIITDIFNLPNYKSTNCNHYGILRASGIPGTENICALHVILVHTEPVMYFSKELGVQNITKMSGTEGIVQAISKTLADEIERMITAKYGQPKGRDNSSDREFYVFEGDEVNLYSPENAGEGELISWETDYLKIRYFKGVISPNTFFNTTDNSYITKFKDGTGNIEYIDGEIRCKQFPFITYELKKETIQKLGLDKTKL